MRTPLQEFTKGFWEQIPPFRLVLGICPTLAVTKSLEGGWGMGLATTFVLVCSNIFVSALRKVVPPKVRIATFIVIIATFVVITELVMKAYTPMLSDSLGVFIPLIVVNCIILGRAEAFASKNGVGRSLLDGLGIGLGYTLALSAIGCIRELCGTGGLTLFSQANLGVSLIPLADGQEFLFKFMVDPPGAFVTLGGMLMLMNIISARSAKAA
ncbi:MAG: electron transport complex subunit E [Candidatus Eisenbacteria bacterium]|uniref:Ion-translocating oxidoreductase complex subunit E n=1 Tax=Eiseniibacteriota bacterium TaxID=2212470 RepID=A0A948RW10_UNCEI|nr:electron transport complex subunit E [Candidatus Eisenbacteria bacterium]MBU1951264.1 electron transport complex subunit E [Candidatus Eisenbacteria bacterium]MBU2691006.1 electron transport complex subunit E [Candidatus Eisenbacteria bacterium]